MQVVIALPAAADIERLEQPVCGIPLLTRVIAAAARAGGSRVLLLAPKDLQLARLTRAVRTEALEPMCFCVVDVPHPFDPYSEDDWRSIAEHLEDRFLWSPCDYVAYRAALKDLAAAAASRPRVALRFEQRTGGLFEQLAVVLKRDVIDGDPEQRQFAMIRTEPGISARPPVRISDIEAELVRRSGKETDGIYSRFNRKLCRPAVRWLSHTRITPNAVSFAGLAVAVISGACFAQGTWAWDILGALLFFASGLFDEIDGMLARVKFQESAFGCWLETFVDYATYLLAFAGMAIGGYVRSGPLYLWIGFAVLAGCLLSFFVISVQRKLSAASAPTEYYQRHLKALDRDSHNPISKGVRILQFLLRKGVLIHYVLLFAVCNIIAVLFFLAAIGANAAWIVTVYLNRRLYLSRKPVKDQPAARWPAQVEAR